MTTNRSRTPRATPFKATRKHHGLEAAEDYTELIAELIHRNGKARTVEIARHLGVSHVTAIRTLQRLKREGLVKEGTHRPIELTDKGAKLACAAQARHKLLVDFFVAIGVPERTAEIDVEGAEHHISSVTLDCIRRFLLQL